MSARPTIRRMILLCTGAVAVLVMSAGVAAAQSAEDCDGLEAISEELAQGCRDFAETVEGEEGGEGDEGAEDESSPLDDLLGALEEQGLDPAELCALREESPEEFEAILDAFGPVVDELCPPEEEDEPEDPAPEPEEPSDETGDAVDTTTSGELPNTGGLAGLAGLGMLGAGAALRRLRVTGADAA